MKRKHSGLLICAIAILAILASGAYMTWRMADFAIDTRVVRKPLPATIGFVPPSSAVGEIDVLERDITHILKPRVADSSPVNLILFGREPGQLETTEPELEGREVQVRTDYKLTLTFRSNTRRFCFIDGTLYEEGNVLADGAKILRIDHNRVLISSRKIKAWIPLAEKEALPKEKK
jgi:hypothetical protein